MLSPAGVKKKPDNYDEMKLKRKNEKKSLMYKLFETSWEKKWSPFGIMRKSGFQIGSYLTDKFIKRRMGNLPEDELKDLSIYM